MIYGESFEQTPESPVTWPNTVKDPRAQASVGLTGDSFHGHTSLGINYTSGDGLAGLANRGIGNEGLVFIAVC